MQVTKKFGKVKKVEQLTKLTNSLTKAKTIVLADYTGLTHKQLEEVRKLVKKADGELAVTKNSLLKKALSESKKTIAEEYLNGATATLFAYVDEVAPLTALVKFFKDATKGHVKAGLLGTTAMNALEVEKLSALPGRTVLLSRLVGQLQGPLYGLHNALTWNIRQFVYALNSIKEAKSKTSA